MRSRGSEKSPNSKPFFLMQIKGQSVPLHHKHTHTKRTRITVKLQQNLNRLGGTAPCYNYVITAVPEVNQMSWRAEKLGACSASRHDRQNKVKKSSDINLYTSVAAAVSTCVHAYLFDVCVIKVHPPADLSLEEESGVMFPVVAHHPDQVELGLPSLLLGHPVEQLQRGEDVTARR